MTVGFGSICFVLWYGGREVIQDHMSAGDLTQFLLYLALVSIGVGSLGSIWGDFMSAIGASQRIFEILERTPEMSQQGNEIEKIQGSIEFKNVHFSYPSRPHVEILKGVSFKINPGQRIALVGSSGSGKTTIGSLIPRFMRLTQALS